MNRYLSDESDSDDELLMNAASRIRRPKTIRARIDHFVEWNDQEFFMRFRLTKPTVSYLLQLNELIEVDLDRGTVRALSPMNKLLMTLRFYALGTMLIAVGDFAGVHKSTASVVIKQVSLAIARLVPQFIHFPRTEEETNETYRSFYEKQLFPRVLGAIDCTHIRIQGPGGDDGEVFRNRKGWFSLNIQTISDAKTRITDLVTRWPGSAHDQNIFYNSWIRARLEMGEFNNGIILGDSGYALKPYLLTPIRNAQDLAEQLYNEAQIRTRSTVERQYGIWKRRFSVLSLGLRLLLDTVQDVIAACAVSHDVASDRNEPVPPHDPQIPDLEINNDQIPRVLVEGRENEAVQRAMVEYYRQKL